MAPSANEPLYREKDFICILAPGKQPNKYGIIVQNVLRGAYWGSCIMYNPEGNKVGNTWGTIVTFGDKALKLAWDRVNNKDETSPYKEHVPKLALLDLLAQGRAQGEVFTAAIAESEKRFADELELRTTIKRAAARKRSPASCKPFVPFMKKPVPYPVGTKVYAHFKWKELFISKEDGRRRSKQPGCTRSGRDYVGTVTKYVENEDNLPRTYTCMFDTPSKHTLNIDEKHLQPLIDAYEHLENESSADGLSSPEKDVSVPQPRRKKIEGRRGSSKSAPQEKASVEPVPEASSMRTELPIGTDVTRWVTKVDLFTMGDIEVVEGVWIDGIICAVRQNKGRRGSPGVIEYDISFELPPLCKKGDHVNKWYHSAETHDMTHRYQQRHDKTAAAYDTYLKPSGDHPRLCKGSKQASQVNEACFVAKRPTRRTKSLIIPQTPEDPVTRIEIEPPTRVTTTGLQTTRDVDKGIETSREDWKMNDPRDRLRFEIEEALVNEEVEQEVSHLCKTVGTVQDSAQLQHRRNLLSFHLAGGAKPPEYVGNVPTSGNQALHTSPSNPGKPPPPPPPARAPSVLDSATSTHVDYIVSMASPTIVRTGDCNMAMLALSDETKQHLKKLGLTQLRNGKILAATAEESRNEDLDNAALSLLHADKTLVFVPRDGNCMFNALAICYGGATSAAAIRQAAVTYVVGHWDDPEFPYGEFVRNCHPNETTDTYTHRLNGPGKDWGDYPELVAATNVYRHHLYLLDLDADERAFTTHYIEAEDLEENATTHFVVRVGDNHYHAGPELIISLY